MNPAELASRFPLSKHGIDIQALADSYRATLPSPPPPETRLRAETPPALRATPEQLWGGAYEEAGHGLAAHLLGGRCLGMTLEADGSGGCDRSDLPSADAEALFYAAGAAAQALCLVATARLLRMPVKAVAPLAHGHDRDYHRRSTGLAGLAADARWRSDVDRAEEMLRPHAGCLAPLAQALYRERHLDADRVAAVIRAYLWT